MVTVLFADLVGSTARAEQLDPEEVRAILAPFYARVRAELAIREWAIEGAHRGADRAPHG